MERRNRSEKDRAILSASLRWRVDAARFIEEGDDPSSRATCGSRNRGVSMIGYLRSGQPICRPLLEALPNRGGNTENGLAWYLAEGEQRQTELREFVPARGEVSPARNPRGRGASR